MNSQQKLSCAIAAILSGSTAGVAHATTATETATAEEPTETIAEITVTAQRRTESLQDVPITIQALTGDTLKQLNVTTFDDFIKYLPNVTQASAGPGQSTVFMRGVSAGITGQQGTGTTGPIPNVSVYLDDQSAAIPGRNLDVYAVDLERIEVLEGPQGTLFGSGAEAGVLRYITNKPKLDVTEGNVDASYSYTAHGDPNASADGVINVPLIPDTLAVRAVIYTDSRGGYINNVPATFQRYGTDEGLASGNGGVVPTNSLVINNNNLLQNAFNPVTYTGIRASVLYKINDDWDALLTQSYQNMYSQGVFYEMPNGPEGITYDAKGEPVGGEPLPPLSVALFEPSYNKDRYEDTAFTLDGKVGDLKLVYSGAYLVRNIEQQQDYTNYARGVYGYYYQCAGYSSNPAMGFCNTPASTWQESEQNTHQSHELRLSTPDDWRGRGIIGLYWEQFTITDLTQWLYKSVPNCSPTDNVNCFNPVQPWPGDFTNLPGVRNENVGFFDDAKRNIFQRAIFGSTDFDIIPKTLTLTAGTRYYRFNEDVTGGDVGSFYCKAFAPTTYYGPCTSATNGNGKPGGIGILGSAPYGTDLALQDPNSSEYHGFRSRANLTWHVDSDVLVYYTWSQGFRPGGFNRGSSQQQKIAGVPQWFSPKTYSPDSLINNELGFKTEWLGRRLEVNGAVYQEDWKNAIVEFFDPQGGFGNLTFVTNGPNYRVRGVELQLTARVTEGLTVIGAVSNNDGVQTNSPVIIDNNPASPYYGGPILNPKTLQPIPNVFSNVGAHLANAPEVQANLRVRYDFNLGDTKSFAQIGAQHVGSSNSGVGTVDNYFQPGFTTYDASFGFAKEAWNLQFFAENLTNVNASVFTNSFQFIKAETVIRPRVAGVKIGYKF